ncbi:MAG: glutathione S-transferase N-terminal domain-containing protein [Bdellovibrionaceae bacterium]|nr:glutathione S-transferase N-terminal domain-containing protein [Pseudobdellovibrionaceae bacterium]
MIDFYSANTPNVQKVHIMLEELGLPYKLHPVDLKANQQKSPEFLAINPNGKVPAIVDNEGTYGRKISIFESGAILFYLAEKTRHFMGENDFDRAQVMSWVMFQMSGIGPIFGNFNYGKSNNIPPMATRFEVEGTRVMEVMNKQLAQNEYLAGNFYSIADIATYSWMVAGMRLNPGWFEKAPHVRRWMDLIAKRQAVKKAMGT